MQTKRINKIATSENKKKSFLLWQNQNISLMQKACAYYRYTYTQRHALDFCKCYTNSIFVGKPCAYCQSFISPFFKVSFFDFWSSVETHVSSILHFTLEKKNWVLDLVDLVCIRFMIFLFLSLSLSI